MNRGLLIALLVVGAATAYLQTQDDDALVAQPANGARREARTASPEQDTRTRTGKRAEAPMDAWAADALVQGAQAWQARATAANATAGTTSAWSAVNPPAPPVLKPPAPHDVLVVAPPAPTAPRFPHAWVGRFNDGAVLSGPDTTWVVHAGDVIEGQWRVDRVEERRMSLTFLPLNQTQQVVMR